MKISEKDWSRMTDLVLSGKDGAGTAAVLKDKNKAITRFVAGVRLENNNLNYSETWKEYNGQFSEFGNKALKLGATVEEIQSVFDENSVHPKYVNKIIDLSAKKLNNRFVGDISRAIMGAGFDIKYLPHNGNAITMEGKDAMARNGRKWTIGYKVEIDMGTQTHKLTFDAITDEGYGPTSYMIDDCDSSGIFCDIENWQPISKLKFIKEIKNALVVK